MGSNIVFVLEMSEMIRFSLGLIRGDSTPHSLSNEAVSLATKMSWRYENIVPSLRPVGRLTFGESPVPIFLTPSTRTINSEPLHQFAYRRTKLAPSPNPSTNHSKAHGTLF